MANERLRQAIYDAGLDVDQLADKVEVDVKTVYRWLSGRVPLPRLRAKVARAVGREQQELWPELATQPVEDEEQDGAQAAAEIVEAWARWTDAGVPDWQDLLEQAHAEVDLLGYSLIDVVSIEHVIDTLKAKADVGVRVRILISAPDSVWVTAAARELEQEEDYIGRPELRLEIERARAYVDPLAGHPDIDLRQFIAAPGYTILRFDDHMLVMPHLHGVVGNEAPLVHVHRGSDGGLFDQFEAHVDAITARASEPIAPAPDAYPNPTTHPERYQPLTEAAYEREREATRQRNQSADAPSRPIEQVRAEMRRPDPPADSPATD